MPKLRIVTSQNVTIDYELATVMERILCGVIDTFIQFIYVLIWMSAFSTSLYFYADFSVMVFLIPVMVDSLVFETLFNGRTPAKMILGIKVVRLYGDRAAQGRSDEFFRTILKDYSAIHRQIKKEQGDLFPVFTAGQNPTPNNINP